MQSINGPGFADQSASQKVGLALLEILGLSKSEVEKLKDIPHDELLAAGNEAVAKVRQSEEGITSLGWSPVFDGQFIPYQPSEIRREMSIAKDVLLFTGTYANGIWNELCYYLF
jgi:para-nitrobenzyl esterase